MGIKEKKEDSALSEEELSLYKTIYSKRNEVYLNIIQTLLDKDYISDANGMVSTFTAIVMIQEMLQYKLIEAGCLPKTLEEVKINSEDCGREMVCLINNTLYVKKPGKA
jgi:hypothetical protein